MISLVSSMMWEPFLCVVDHKRVRPSCVICFRCWLFLSSAAQFQTIKICFATLAITLHIVRDGPKRLVHTHVHHRLHSNDTAIPRFVMSMMKTPKNLVYRRMETLRSSITKKLSISPPCTVERIASDLIDQFEEYWLIGKTSD
ncbi:unnamed protein product [Haemonchus placei]|uniref:Histone domain-containing protein n=1 Tax=Haemonchus placei TaxID=6290 RepID=A0A0N4WW06_HAEPC|nr:unnamed protein product [Haemonchus placei]